MFAPLVQRWKVDGVGVRVDADGAGVLDRVEGGGGVEQCLGGDASAIQAGATGGGVAFDEGDGVAELGCA